MRNPDTNSSGGGITSCPPIARTFALVVLFALAALIVLRHLFGGIRIEGGFR